MPLCHYATMPLQTDLNFQEGDNTQKNSFFINKGIVKATKVAIILFIGAIATQPLFPLLKPLLNPLKSLMALPLNTKRFKNHLFKKEIERSLLGVESHQGKDTPLQNLRLPSVKETQQAIKDYWQVVESIRSEGTLSPEDIRRQGYNIKPLTPRKVQLTKNQRQELFDKYSQQTQSYNNNPQMRGQEVSNRALRTSHPYKKGLFVRGDFRKNQNVGNLADPTAPTAPNAPSPSKQVPRYPNNEVEKFYFSMDIVSKQTLLEKAYSLPSSTSLSQAKALLGAPSKETFITEGVNQPDSEGYASRPSNTLQKAIVYYIKKYQAGKKTPHKDQELILTFNEDNLLESVYLSNQVQS